jgi:putative phosphoesterase
VKIGIVSDTHNAEHNTRAALAVLRDRGIDRLIHCGAITTPEIVYLFSGFEVAFVFGNMDNGRTDLVDAARQIGVQPPKLVQEVEIAGKTIAACHGSDHSVLYRLMMGGRYPYVCHGHTHERRNEFRSAYSVRLICPGALGGSQPQTRSFCILDVIADTVEFVELPALM